MPLEGLEEEGLPKIPDLQLVQLKFLLTVQDGVGVDKEGTWATLLEAITKDGEKAGKPATLTGYLVSLCSHGAILLLCVCGHWAGGKPHPPEQDGGGEQ